MGGQPITAELDCTVVPLRIAGVIPRWSGFAMFVRSLTLSEEIYLYSLYIGGCHVAK